MTFQWDPISKPIAEASNAHNIIVVGSGYGGGVAASRFARTGQHVTVLERGQEIAPGDYPRNGAEMAKSVQVRIDPIQHRVGDMDALFDLRVGKDVSVLVGCGLGGTSLINANVAITPDVRVFDTWPAPYRGNAALLGPYVARARQMLGSMPYPADKAKPKLFALEQAAKGMKAPFARPDINVTFKAGPNAAGVWQDACNDCGDCVSGCNYGAKNTVLMNYLPDAKAWGADIFTGACVSHVSKTKTGWAVIINSGDGERTLTANMVILAAGTLGSTEILLRSQKEGLAISDQIGKRFSGNGDVYAFGYNASFTQDGEARAPIFGVGAGPHNADKAEHQPGPCITGMIDLRDEKKPLTDGILIEEGVMPGALAAGYAAAFPAMAALIGDPMRFGDTALRLQDMAELAAQIGDDPAGLADTVYSGPMSRTMPFLVMSHDEADGQLCLHPDTASVELHWDNAGLDPAIVKDANVVRAACDAIGAEYLPMPFWQDAFGNRLVTVHPLGGCAMGESAADGVVSPDCEVFDGAGSTHKGLYVCDGAVIPGAIGVNPHLTITAVAERAIDVAVSARKWTIDWTENAPMSALVVAQAATFDPMAQLDRMIGTLQELKRTIEEGGARSHLRVAAAIRRLWGKVIDGQKAALSRKERKARPLPRRSVIAAKMAYGNNPNKVVLPIVEQALDALLPIRDALVSGDASYALSLFQTAFGDVSPAAYFEEIMTGHVSDVGLKGAPDISDPYAIAGQGPRDCTFHGRIRTESIQSLLAEPDTPARIIDGTFHCGFLKDTFDIIDGEYRFLVPDKTQIEMWNMCYRGTLRAQNSDKIYQFEGKKTLRRQNGSHWWSDLTILDVDISDQDHPVAKGQISVSFEDIIEQARDLTMGYDNDVLLHAFRAAYDTLEPVYEHNFTALPKAIEDKALRAQLVKFAILCLNALDPDQKVIPKIENAFEALTLGKMGALVMRNYGGLYSYMANFPAKAAPATPKTTLPTPSYYHPESEPGVRIKLTRYKGGKKGPVILAGGFGTKASSFALPTVDQNIVEALTDKGFDVWLFDYRGSGDLKASLKPFNLDDVALKDWPAAISTVLEVSKPKTGNVQTLVHCIGSMTLFMAILAGENRVRSVIASQLATHAITNWLNYAKADGPMADALINGLPRQMWPLINAMPLGPALGHYAKHGLDVLDPRSPSLHYQNPELDLAVDGLVWGMPAFGPVGCNSPTCHRITAIFGPSYNHAQLNQATHDHIADLFGPLSPVPFAQIGEIYKAGHVLGNFDYMGHAHRLNMPIHFFSGAENQEMLPEATLRAHTWLNAQNPEHRHKYSREVFQGFGHMDCFIGKDAHKIIFRPLLARLCDTA